MFGSLFDAVRTLLQVQVLGFFGAHVHAVSPELNPAPSFCLVAFLFRKLREVLEFYTEPFSA